MRQIAAQEGLSATFMAKWHEDYSGNSGHIHQSFSDTETGIFRERATDLELRRYYEIA